MIAGSLLLAATEGVGLGCGALAALACLTRVGRRRRVTRRRRLLALHRADLIAVSAGEDSEGASLRALATAPRRAQAALAENVAGMLGKVRGLPAEQLVDLLREHDALDRARVDLGHRSRVRRARATQLLGLSRDSSAVEALLPALYDRSPEVRASAAYALGLIGDPRAAGPLLRATGSPSGGLPAGLAAEALLGMGVGMSDALGEGLREPDPRARTVAAHLCGAGSFTRPRPILRELLARDPDLTVRETCAVALGRIGRTEDAEALARHTEAEHPLPLRRVCAAALGELADPTAVPTLAALLHDPDPRLAELAAAALVRVGPAGRDALDAAHHRGPVRSALTLARLQGALP